MRITTFRRRPRFIALAVILWHVYFSRGFKQAAAILSLSLLAACGRKPATSVSAVAACGPLPVKVMLCIETLPTLPSGEIDRTRVTQADLQRCMVNTVDQLIGENQQLRKQFAPCAK